MTSRQGMSSPVWGASDYSSWSIKPESLDWYARNTRSMAGLASANGAKFIHLRQPELICGSRTPTPHESEQLSRIVERMPPLVEIGPLWFEQARTKIAEVRQDLHDGHSVWIEDASVWLDDEVESVYFDYVHYNKLGQKLMGERIAQTILSMQEEKFIKDRVCQPKENDHISATLR